MTAADDARKAIAEALVAVRLDTFMGEASGYGTVPSGTLAAYALAAVMPDGRTIAQHLDELPVAIRVIEGHLTRAGTLWRRS